MSASDYEYSDEESFEYSSGNEDVDKEMGPDIEIQNNFHMGEGEDGGGTHKRGFCCYYSFIPTEEKSSHPEEAIRLYKEAVSLVDQHNICLDM